MAIKTFESRNMDVFAIPGLGVSGVFVDGEQNPAETYKGIICAKGAHTPSRAFDGVKNRNTFYMSAATATDTDVYVCDVQITELAKMTNGKSIYAGANTLELSVPADFEARYEKLVPGKEYVFGDGNFTTAPTVSDGAITTAYATIEGGSLVATASAPESGAYFEIVDTVTFTEGTRNAGNGFLCVFRA